MAYKTRLPFRHHLPLTFRRGEWQPGYECSCLELPYKALMNISRNAAVAIFGAVVLVIIGVFVLSGEYAPHAADQEPAPITPALLQTAPPAPGIKGTISPPQAPTLTLTTSATLDSVTIAAARPVAFTLDPGTPISCGLTCRETTATITNTGDGIAHSVCVILEVFNENGERIFINSGPLIEHCLGDIGGGESRIETIMINADCGFLAGKCIGHTLVMKARATSAERTQAFPDSFIRV